MIKNYISEPDIVNYSKVVNAMRSFFLSKNFVEVHTQDRLSILAACEDPSTVATYDYMGERWPLPQTGQMWLEYELLTKPELPGVFCVSTSYRAEPHPIEGRHKLIFSMFEFESHGDIDTLRKLESELLDSMGFGAKGKYAYAEYKDVAERYEVRELEHTHETKMQKDYSPILFLENFPRFTSPFWNMKKANSDFSRKIDVIMYGQETIGSAERSSNKREMEEEFYTISKGGYAQKLFDLFGKGRVEKELKEYLSLDFFPRCGGGIGVSRMMSAYKQARLQN